MEKVNLDSEAGMGKAVPEPDKHRTKVVKLIANMQGKKPDLQFDKAFSGRSVAHMEPQGTGASSISVTDDDATGNDTTTV
ncbi:MAG: hypothetical protein LBD34_01785, partial [Puniceicoccales bacterium]|nr:hypothetical protein [Puniceicoccales bacterium]